MDSVIHERLLGVEDDFIKSSVEDVLGFETRFRNLHQVISMAMADNELSPDTLILAHTVSASVGTLAQSFLSLHLDEQRLTTSLHEEFARVLDRDSIAHGQPAVARSPHSPIDSEAAEERSSYPPHIFSAYKWLLKNIHNPYPTEATKEAISTQTGSSREIVDDWFIRARRTMGWTALCKKHHAKSRKETLDAAYRFFVAPDPKRPLDSDLEYDFAMVLNTAKSMYSEKLLKSALAVKLDVVVKDMTPLDRAKRKEDKQLEKQMKKLQAKNNVRAISSYPSPDRSPSRSPDLSLPSVIVDESDCDTSPPEPVAGRKRQSSSSNSSHWTYEVQAGRPNKRPRYIAVVISPTCPLISFWVDPILLHLTATILSRASQLPHRLPTNSSISVFNHHLHLPNPRLLPPLRQCRRLHQQAENDVYRMRRPKVHLSALATFPSDPVCMRYPIPYPCQVHSWKLPHLMTGSKSTTLIYPVRPQPRNS
jgi:hypothetical protein